MGADVSASGSPAPSSRSGAVSSSEAPSLAQCLPLDPVSLSSQKYTRSGELRRVLGLPLGYSSGNHSYVVSNFKHSPPVATEELRHFKDSVADGSRQARERSRMFRDSIFKLEKYKEVVGSKKRQRADLSSNEKSGGSTISKTGGQFSRNIHDHSALRSDDKTKSNGFNKRARSSVADLKADCKSSAIREKMVNERDTDVLKASGVPPVQPEERIRRLSAMGEGWDKKMKRRRSVGMMGNRASDSDVKQSIQSKLSSESKLTAPDAQSLRAKATQALSIDGPGTFIKGKIARAPRSGTVTVMNSADYQMSSKASGGWEQPAEIHPRGSNPSHVAQWIGQRPQKNSRTRRTNVVSPVPSYDETRNLSPSLATSGFGHKSSPDRNDGSTISDDTESSLRKTKIKSEKKDSPVQLFDMEKLMIHDHIVKGKGPDSGGDALPNGNRKLRVSAFPMKRKQAIPDEQTGDGGSRHGRSGQGLCLPKPAVSQMVDKLDNGSLTKSQQNARLGSDKNKSRSGRSPSKKLSDHKGLTRAWKTLSDDDHDELVVAANSARKARYLACPGKFWKKMEPVFGSVSAEDACYLKHELSSTEKTEESLSQMLHAEYDVTGLFMNHETPALSKQGSLSYQSLDKDDPASKGLGIGRRSDKVSSLYQRVLSALIEEEDSDGICNGSEGISSSFQCTSDDSHCGSCNYTDAEMRDRDRLESEAESIVDAHIPKRCSGDRFSCNKSFTSNTSRNLSMSDSLYSSGRWLGDDSFSHSDVEFVSGICNSDLGGSQPSDVNLLAAPVSDGRYQLLCLDDKLLLELQSVGLFLDSMPDLAEGEEVIDQDIIELKEGLHQQVGKKKMKLISIEKAVQVDKDNEKMNMEHVAMNHLIEMAYRRRMACKRSNSSKTVLRKVSKQVAVGFVERTLARCRNFELTGRSCFSDPAFLKIIMSPPGNDVKSMGCESDRNPDHGADNQQAISGLSGPDSTILGGSDFQNDNLGRGSLDSVQAGSISVVPSLVKRDLVIHRGRKRELLLDDVGGVSNSRGGADYGTPLMSNSVSESSQQSAGSFKAERKVKAKPKQRGNPFDGISKDTSVTVVHASSNSVQSHPPLSIQNAAEEEEPIDFSQLPMPEFESIEHLGGGSNDPHGWFNLDDMELNDHDSIGLEIPPDDLGELMFL